MDLKFNGGRGHVPAVEGGWVSSAATQPVTGAAGRRRHTLFNETWGKKTVKKQNHFGDPLFQRVKENG